ncbi:MAG: SpaA isopeptide-forming pilin-related protein, partial [Gemmiger sp.]
PIAVSFTYPGPQTAWQVVAATQADQPLDKLTIHKTDAGGKELPGAKLTVTTLEDEPVDSWVSEEAPHTLPILEPNAEEQDGAIRYSDGENEFVYILHEDAAPDGYLVATDIQFKVERDAEGRIAVYTRVTAAVAWHKADGASVTMVDEARPQPTPTPTPTPTVTVTATPTPTPVLHVPQTGDSTPLLAIVITTAVAAAGFVTLLAVRHRKDRLEEENDPQLEPRDDPEDANE